MKSIFKIIFPAVLFVTFLSASAQAQNLKIATVDLGRVFTNYYKTKLAQTQLNDDKAQVYQDENNAVAELKKGDADYQSLLTSANDSALSADERDKKKQAAAAKLQDLQSKKAALDEYLRSAQARLTDEMQRVHDKILFEIRDTVTAQAKVGGYTLVVDSASETVNGTPVIVYDSGQNDLTDDVIKQLNAGAPIDLDIKTSAPTPLSLSTNTP